MHEQVYRSLLLMEQFKCLCLQSKHEGSIDPARLADWRQEAERFVEHIAAKLEGARLICERYFDGSEILYPKEQQDTQCSSTLGIPGGATAATLSRA
jgi:hypothetical protein